MIDHLGFQPAKSTPITCSIGYVFIPKDVDRNQFVETSMRNGTCAVIRDNSFGLILNVRVGIEEIQLIDWPEKTGLLGSTVVLVMDNFKQTYNIVAVLNGRNEVLKAKEGVRIIQKQTEKGTVSITLDANRPTAQILVENGDIEVISRGGKVNIISDEEVSIKTPKIAHNKAEEPMLRGQKVVDLMEELIDLLFKARTATSIGLQPLNNFVQINELKQKLEELKSTKSFLE